MNFLGGAVRLGRLFGVDVRVHVLYLIWAAFQLMNAGEYWKIEVIWLAMLFGIILAHEFGHCFGARAVGGYAVDILMWPLGGLATIHAPMRPWPQFVAIAAGPLVNVAFCIMTAVVLIATTGQFDLFSLNPFGMTVSLPADAPRWAWYLALFYQVNYFLLIFNLLPIFPMDGGQLFLTLMWPFIGLQRATTIACQVGLGGACFLGAWALMRMNDGSGGSILLLIAIVGGMTCWQRLQMARMGMIFDERIGTYDHVRRDRGGGGFWARWFKRGDSRRTRTEQANPNPGAWEAKLAEERGLTEEVDRILQKVHERGMQSLTYIERQTLERASRQRQRDERDIQGRG